MNSSKLRSIKEKDIRTYNLIRNSVFAIVSRGINLLVSLISVPLLLNYMGVPSFGVYSIMISVPSVVNFIDLGMSLGLMNNVSNYITDTDPLKLRKATTATFLISSIISISLLLLFFLAFSFFDIKGIFGLTDHADFKGINLMIGLFAIAYLIGAPFNMVNNFLIGNQQAYFVEIGKTAYSILQLLLFLIAIHFKWSPYIFSVLYILSISLINLVIFFIVFFFLRKDISPSRRYIDTNEIRLVFKNSMKYFVLQLMTILFLSIDPMLIGKFLSTDSVTKYSIMFRVASILTLPVVMYSSQILPLINDAISTKDNKWVKSNIRKILTVSTLYVFLLMFLLYFLGDWILSLWLKDSITFDRLNWLSVFILILLISYNSIVSTIFLIPKLVKKNLYYFPASVILTFALKILLFPRVGLDYTLIITYSLFLFIFCGKGVLVFRQFKLI